MPEEKRFYGYTAAMASGILLAIHVGLGSLFSILIPNYMREMGWTLTQITWESTLCTAATAICSVFGMRAVIKLGTRAMFFFGSVAAGAGTILLGSAHNLITLYLGGIVFGLGLAFACHVCCATFVSLWFIEKRKTITGIVLGFSQFGGAVCLIAGGWLFELMPWRVATNAIGGAAIALGILINLALIRTPDKMNQKPLGWERQGASKAAAAPGLAQFGLSFNEAFKTGAFWLLVAGICLAGMPMTGVKVFGPTFWQSFGMPQQVSANYAGLLTVFCTVAMMISGFIADKLGLKAYITYIFLAFAAGSAMYLYWPLHQSAAYTSLSLVVISLASPTGAISSTITPEVFGPKDFTSINGKIMGAFYFGVAIVAVLTGALRDMTGSFDVVWIFLGVAAIAAMICCLIALRIAPVKKLLNK